MSASQRDLFNSAIMQMQIEGAETVEPQQPQSPKLKKLADKLKQDKIVRKGKGITGVGTAFIDPLLSGRSTLYKLYCMRDKRAEDQAFGDMPDNELDKMRQLLKNKDNLNERREKLLKGTEEMNDNDRQKNLKLITRDKQNQKKEMIRELKYQFQHIKGMWPKTAKFVTNEERMQSWQTDLLIKRQIFTPSKRLLVCEQGINEVLQKHLRYEAFLKKFRTRSTD